MAELAAPPPPLAAPPIAVDPSQQVAGASVVAPAPVAAAPPQPVEEFASETLYIQNLNEKIKIPILKASLRSLFKAYGEVLDVVAHANLRMRGQAFVSFENAEIAKKALKEVRGFPLYSKPMVSNMICPATILSLSVLQQISFARTRSDAVVKRFDGGNFEAHKKRRDEHKSA